MQRRFGYEEQQLQVLQEQKLAEVDQAVCVHHQWVWSASIALCLTLHTVLSWQHIEDNMLSPPSIVGAESDSLDR